MRIFMFLLAIFTFVIGLVELATANTPTRELEGYLLLLIAAVSIGAAGIIESINLLRKEVGGGAR